MSLALHIDGRTYSGSSPDFLAERLAALRQAEYADVRLIESEGSSIQMLKSGPRAILICLGVPEGESLTSRATATDAPHSDEAVDVQLAGGESRQYPAICAIPFLTACRAVEHFRFSKRAAPFVEWRAR